MFGYCSFSFHALKQFLKTILKTIHFGKTMNDYIRCINSVQKDPSPCFGYSDQRGSISLPLLRPAAGYAIFKIQKEQPPTRWVDLEVNWNLQNHHSFARQSSGVVFLCLKTLSDKRKYECQQCENEHTKRHKVVEIKMIIVHQHHPHSMQNRGQPPCNTIALLTI